MPLEQMPAAEYLKRLFAMGYFHPRLLPTGRWAALQPWAGFTSLITGEVGDMAGYSDRWDYASGALALVALLAWDGSGEPAGWYRNPRTGRRVAQADNEYDQDQKRVPVGETYVRW